MNIPPSLILAYKVHREVKSTETIPSFSFCREPFSLTGLLVAQLQSWTSMFRDSVSLTTSCLTKWSGFTQWSCCCSVFFFNKLDSVLYMCGCACVCVCIFPPFFFLDVAFSLLYKDTPNSDAGIKAVFCAKVCTSSSCFWNGSMSNLPPPSQVYILFASIWAFY